MILSLSSLSCRGDVGGGLKASKRATVWNYEHESTLGSPTLQELPQADSQLLSGSCVTALRLSESSSSKNAHLESNPGGTAFDKHRTRPTHSPLITVRASQRATLPPSKQSVSTRKVPMVVLETPVTFTGRTTFRFMTDSYSAMYLSRHIASHHACRVGVGREWMGKGVKNGTNYGDTW